MSALSRPANLVLAVAVGLALLRLFGLHRRAAQPAAQARAVLLQSVAGEEDPGAALDELELRRPSTGRRLH